MNRPMSYRPSKVVKKARRCPAGQNCSINHGNDWCPDCGALLKRAADGAGYVKTWRS